MVLYLGTETDDSGNVMFMTSGWNTRDDVIDNLVTSMRNQMVKNKATKGPWDQYMGEGISLKNLMII